jgi:DNA-binding transcriptional LysR family regulator
MSSVMNRLELRHFRYAVAVAETLHFGEAARRLHISQPPLSQQIRQLEEELGIQIFHRTKRRVQLTKAGDMFIQEARVILAQAEHAARVAERVGEGEAGQLIVAVAGSADSQFFIEVFRLFAKKNPRVRVALRNMSTVQQIEAIREGRIHAGFLVPPVDDPALAFERVIHQQIAVALPREHPLAGRGYVPLSALAAERHIMFARYLAPPFFDAIVAACRDAGFKLNVVHEVDNVNTACALVAAGLGVCFVPAGMGERRSTAIQVRPLRPRLRHVESELVLVFRRELLCDLVQLFVAVVREITATDTPKKVARLKVSHGKSPASLG